MARKAIDQVRACGIPAIFIQALHRHDMIDFGRELDGDEDVHCLENNPNTDIARVEMDFRDTDMLIRKRRYSAFFGTDFEILLKGLKVDTLLLVGGLTDVCVHCTFVDGHKSDYFCRIIEDCADRSSTRAHIAALKTVEYLQTGAVQPLDKVLTAMDDWAGAARS